MSNPSDGAAGRDFPTRLVAESAARVLPAALELAGNFFRPLDALGRLTPAEPADLPAAERALLAHSGHMTETLEAFHRAPVRVRVVGESESDGVYARHSLLSCRSEDRVVQSGVMRIRLDALPAPLRATVRGGAVPLGRILIQAGVLRSVEPLALWRIVAGEQLAGEFQVPAGEVIFGRSARILVQGVPTVELLEIVRP